MSADRPLIAVTMGDPAGIGPEIIAAAWPAILVQNQCRPIVLGRPEILRRAVSLRSVQAKVEVITSPEEARPAPERIPCLACGPDAACDVSPGKLDPRAGQAAYEAVVLAAKLAMSGRVEAIVTAPLQKEALHLAGHAFPGHTELLAELCGTKEFAMLLYLRSRKGAFGSHGLAVIHVTLHLAMREVFSHLSTEAILSKARLVHLFMAELMSNSQAGQTAITPLQSPRPRIGVCALNPHGGEGGLFGNEEISIIRPAVERGQAEGLCLEGPLPADTLLVLACNGRYDAIVAMYHDQGHIPIKLLGMYQAVNVTLGLPIIRTSVSHGTAFDIAWSGSARPDSLVEAVSLAARLAVIRRSRKT